MSDTTSKELASLIPALGREVRLQGTAELRITGLAYDSRRVRPGQLFVALPGLQSDGHRYVDEAIRRGAAAVLHQRELERYEAGVAYLQVPDSRRSMSELAAAFYDHPSRDLTVIGVTGTDGKSTTVWLIHQLLASLGLPSGFVSTVQMLSGHEIEDNPLRQSTPEAPDIQGLLRSMADRGKRFAVLEATSHGLAAQTGRLSSVRFSAGVCTNIGHEHLEFHGSFERYRSDKANLFRALPQSGFGVVNLDDPSHDYLRANAGAPVLGYALQNPDADLRAEIHSSGLEGSLFTLRGGGESLDTRIELPGTYNVENLLAAVLTVSQLGHSRLADLAEAIPRLRGVAGRMEPIRCGQPFRVIVDYAHTPGAFSRLLPLVREATEGRLVAVFGSAGQRDVEKRQRQGQLAARHCEIVILTDEDPRAEQGLGILEQIAAGCRQERPAMRRDEELFLIPNRRRAIGRAFGLAREGDTVLLLGKGHERSILYADGPLPWLEAGVARELLEQMGFGP